MKIGDILKFKKFNWIIVRRIEHISGHIEYKYRVYRKYFKGWIPLSNTECSYSISEWRWKFLKKQLQENPDYHYNMHLWSGCKR